MSRVRRSIEDLYEAWLHGNPEPLDDVIKAFRGIMDKPASDEKSFHKIASYHGAPFRGAGWSNPNWWGGYCAHGNVLFPTWHRAYLMELENALRTVVDDVALPYWDELSPTSIRDGLPRCFLEPKWTYADGSVVDNPLHSYVFKASVWDNVNVQKDSVSYTKKAGYRTVRYPFCGLVGPDQLALTNAHNELYASLGADATDKKLNKNITKWLNSFIHPPGVPDPIPTNTAEKYRLCLDAPNYTVFSNTTSARAWNEEHCDVTAYVPGKRNKKGVVVPLEQPHNDMHLAVGGFDLPTHPDYIRSEDRYANGDMGENETSSYDPLFFFHHAFIDKVFWDWQLRHGYTNKLVIIEHFPGTNTVDAQGPTPGVAANSWLTMETPLEPFRKDDGGWYRSTDVVNIDELGYQYASPSYEPEHPPRTPGYAKPSLPGDGRGNPILPPHVIPVGEPSDKAELSDEEKRLQHLQHKAESTPAPPLYVRTVVADRTDYNGSFVVVVLAKIAAGANGEPAEEYVVARDGVLSRWRVSGCANCQNHLAFASYLPLPKALTLPLKTKDGAGGDDAAAGRNFSGPTYQDIREREVTFEAFVQPRELRRHDHRLNAVPQGAEDLLRKPTSFEIVGGGIRG